MCLGHIVLYTEVWGPSAWQDEPLDVVGSPMLGNSLDVMVRET